MKHQWAYKPIDEIINSIQDTAEILEIIKPIYNFKLYSLISFSKL